MSNLPLLAMAQIWPLNAPPEVIIGRLLIGVGVAWLAISAVAIYRRKLYEVPPVPDLPSPLRPVALLAIIIAAIAAFMAVLSICISAMHLDRAALKTPAGMRQMVFAQPLAQLAAAAVALFLLVNLRSLPSLFYWPRMDSKPVRHALITWLLVLPWVSLVGIIVQQIALWAGADPGSKHTFFVVWQNEPSGVTSVKVVAVLSAAVVAPIAEEIIFRGLLQRMIQSLTRRPAIAVVLASLAFAMVHDPWTLQPGVFVLALFLGLAYFRTGSLLVPIFAHAVFNATNLGLFMLLPR